MPDVPTSTPAATLKTVLIIDDDNRLRPVLAAAMEAHGFRTLAAADASAGIELARTNLPDIILCDIDMPGMNGRRALQTLRADPELADRQFVLMTGNTAYADGRVSMDLGADDFLLKPFSIEDLKNCINARLKRAEVSRHLETRVIDQLRVSMQSSLPHEFFTPLAGVFGLTEMLIEDLDELPKEEVRMILHDILSASRRLHRTLRNYLFIISLDAPSSGVVSVLEPAMVQESILAGINNAAARHRRAGDLKLSLAGARVRSGPTELTALAEELVENAASFSRHGSPIHVTLKPDGASLLLIVKDEGRGMTPKQIQQLGLFQQHDRKHHEQQGLGLGLALCRRIVARLGGTLQLDSEPGRGTVVRATLPVAA